MKYSLIESCCMKCIRRKNQKLPYSAIARRRVAKARGRARTAQNTLVSILPSIPIQNIVISPHNSVVTQLAFAFQGFPTVLPH